MMGDAVAVSTPHVNQNLTVWSLHVLPMPVRVFPGFSGFTDLHRENMLIWLPLTLIRNENEALSFSLFCPVIGW